jgi:hypothetical protein
MNKKLQLQTFSDKEIEQGLHLLQYPGELYKDIRGEFYHSTDHWKLGYVAMNDKTNVLMGTQYSNSIDPNMTLEELKGNLESTCYTLEEAQENMNSKHREQFLPNLVEQRKNKKRYTMLKQDYSYVVNHTTLDNLLYLDDLYISAIEESLNQDELTPWMYLADIANEVMGIVYGSGKIKTMGKSNMGLSEDHFTHYKNLHTVFGVEYNPKRWSK